MYAAPPGLPLMMVLTGTVGRWRLRKEHMTLNFNEALTDGACADVVAFDKTGTLTRSAVRSSCCEAQASSGRPIKPNASADRGDGSGESEKL